MFTCQSAAADIAQQLTQFAQQLAKLQGKIVTLQNDNAQLTTYLDACAKNMTLVQSNSIL
jgi:hypothetical protein